MKKNKDIEIQPDVSETGLIYEPVVEEVKEPTIHDKYDKFIKQARSNYINGIEYYEIMEIVNYISNKMGRNYPVNTSCGTCVIQMLQLFDRIR